MRVLDNLREVEKKGMQSIRRGVNRVREEWADVERNMRQRMRIYPQKQPAVQVLSQAGPAASEDELMLNSRPLKHGRQKPIVSVHGRDLIED